MATFSHLRLHFKVRLARDSVWTLNQMTVVGQYRSTLEASRSNFVRTRIHIVST